MGRAKEYIRKMQKYIADVESGERNAGELERLAVRRHLDDLKYSVERGIYWDEKAAMKALSFFTLLRHYQGEWAGKELILEGWQCFIIGSLFGWKKAGGVRRFNTAYVEVSRKNGKTLLAAGIGLYLLYLDDEQGAQVFSAAVDKEQAKVCWDAAVAMIEQSTPLLKRTMLSKKAIAVESSRSTFKPLSKDTKNKDGFNPHGAIIDEFHKWPTLEIYDVIRSGMGARRQPLIFIITTAGLNLSLPCFGVRKVNVEILKGAKVQVDRFVMIFSMDEGDDWKDSSKWGKAIPNLGISVKPEFMESEFTAVQNDPSKELEFKTKNLNMWVDAPTVWIPDEVILANNFGTRDEDLSGKECYAGLDLASTDDLTALALFFPTLPHPVLRLFFWVPEAKIKQKADRVDYRLWVQQGFITVTEGDVVDTDYLSKDIERIFHLYRVKNLTYDPWMSTNGVIQHLEKVGYYNILDPIAQTITYLSEPTKDLQKRLQRRELDLMNNPVLRWMFRNVAIYTDPNMNIRLNKAKSTEKIDGCAASVNAIAGYISKTASTREAYAGGREIKVI